MNITDTIKWDKRPWFLSIILTACYPYLLILFTWAITNSNSAVAFLSMLVMFAIPALALWSMSTIKNSHSPNPTSQRTLLLFIVAVSPFYIVCGRVFGLIGLGDMLNWIWIISFLALGLLLIRKKADQSKYRQTVIPYNRIQKIHRYSALTLIIGFISLHLSNHLFALHSNAMHEEIRLFFNSWYQSDYVEPVLFTLIATMAITGLIMVRRYSGTDGNIFRVFQISSGFYMVIFFMAHINAILSARDRGVETDWIFATGEYGLIKGFNFLIPYYIFAVLMILLHISLGLRRILLSNGVAHEKANRIFYGLISVGAIITIAISAAILGFQI